MKAWQVKGEWLHKSSGKTHKIEFAVIAEDSDDPIESINKDFDMGGMTYLRGVVTNLDLPITTVMKTDILVLAKR